MRKTILSALAIAPVIAFGQDFTVQGKVGEGNSPAKVYIQYAGQIDSATLDAGSFGFTGKITSPVRGRMFLAHQGEDIRRMRSGVDFLDLYIEPGTIEIYSADSLVHAEVKAGTVNADFKKLSTSKAAVTDKMKAVDARYLAASEEERKSEDFLSSLREEFQAAANEGKKIDLAFAAQHTGSPVSLDILNQYLASEPLATVIEPAFAALSADLRNSEAGQALATQIKNLKATDIGATAPDFTQADTAGNPVSLTSFRGKFVLIDFWASWCGPCRQENPNVVEAFNAYKDKNFTILGVSLDQANAKDRWMKAIHDDNLESWTQVSDLKGWNNEVAKLYGVRAIPQNFLIDPEGRIIAKNLRDKALHEKLAEILN